MIGRLLQNLLRRLLPVDRYLFRRICKGLGYDLDYAINKDAVRVLEAIFIEREYADWFPFYEKVVIVDVGGHYGYFSLFAAMNTAEGSAIYAIEPSAKNAAVFNQNVATCGFQNIHLLQKGLAAKPGEGQLLGKHSFNYHIHHRATKAGHSIELISLAQVMERFQLDHIDFLKLDCEGAEYEIILHAPDELLGRIRILSMEFHDMRHQGFRPIQLVARLEAVGFKIRQYHFDPDYAAGNLNFGKIIATQ
ncbi:MAG: FkbM family methyltransferase [Bacteroidota bacterium]